MQHEAHLTIFRCYNGSAIYYFIGQINFKSVFTCSKLYKIQYSNKSHKSVED